MSAASTVAAPRRRVLAVVSRFKWTHIDYLHAIGTEVDLQVAWSTEAHEGSVARAVREGLRLHRVPVIDDDGEDAVRAALGAIIEATDPSVIHVMYYHHERLTLLTREVAGPAMPLVFECRDPVTMIRRARHGDAAWQLEDAALRASDGQIFVCRALGEYYEQLHGLSLGGTSIVVPHAYPLSSMAPLSPKLSAVDGRVHIAIMGTAAPGPGTLRWYEPIIRRLVDAGFVVHTHFHEIVPLDAYEALDAELTDYQHHPTVVFRGHRQLSELVSRYDLMGVLYEFSGPDDPAAQILRVGMPAKSASAWFHGAIPVLTFSWFEGLREWIEPYGTGFMIDSWDELPAVAADRQAIELATQACRPRRTIFSHEHHAASIAALYETTASSVAGGRVEEPEAASR